MGFAFVVFLAVSTVFVISTPPPTPREKAFQLLTGKFPVDSRKVLPQQKRVGLKTYYVYPGTFTKTAASNTIRVQATYSVSDYAHYQGFAPGRGWKRLQDLCNLTAAINGNDCVSVAHCCVIKGYTHIKAAVIISKMTQRMPSDIFHKLANSIKVGVFTKSEGLTVFPEYANLRDRPGCYNGVCDGACATTCTIDDRKYSTLAGTGGQVTAIVEDNILCNGNDPYHGGSNQLVHEFAHTVMRYGISSSTKSQITSAYNHARAARLWTPGVYAMQNEEEYWAESTQVFFNVEHLSYTTGGMNTCNTGSYCTSEQASRHWLGQHDLTLYNLLQYVWTNNQGFHPSGLKVCQR